jgi:superfamily II DNA or RNA helicase
MQEMKLLVDNSMCTYKTLLSKELYSDLRKRMSYLQPDFFFRDGYKKFHSDGRKYLIKSATFPRGLLCRFEEFCKDHDFNLVIEYVDTGKIKNAIEFMQPQFNLNDEFVLRDYQEKAVQAILDNKMGIVQAPTGSGKSLIMAHTLARINKFPALIVLSSDDLLDQTVKHYENYLQIPVGRIAAGKYDIRAVTVGMSQTLNSSIGKKDASVLRYLASVKVLLCDEAHHVRSDSIKRIAYKCQQAEYKGAYSATPFRDSGDDLEIEAATGPIVYKIGLDELIKLGFLVKPRIYFFHIPKIKIDKVAPTYQDIISDYVESSPVRNGIIAQLVGHLLNEDRTILVLVNRIEHGDLLAELIPNAIFVHGNTPSEERKEYFKQFKQKNIPCMICSGIADEGFDAPSCDCVVLAHPYKSLVKAYQRIGRVMRTFEGKQDALVIDFYDDKIKYLKDHAKRRLQLYQSESGFEILESRLEI